MVRRVVAILSLMVGVFVIPSVVGVGMPTVQAAGPLLTAVNPVRLLDTRPDRTTVDGQAQQTGIRQAKTTFELQVTGRGGIPADAAAVMLNVTVANPAGPGFITVYPCGIDRPTTSNVNYSSRAVANAVLAKVGADGKVCLYTENTVNIIADVNAYIPAGASPTPLNPARLLDTRPDRTTVDGQAQQTGIRQAKTTFELQVTGRGGIPADAAAVMLNVTVANPAGPGFVTVYPCGIDRPTTSNLNYANTAVPNAVLTKIGTDGKVCLYTENTVNIIADVNGYTPLGAAPTPLNPARLLDTRPEQTTIDGQAQQIGVQQAGTTFELPVTGRAGIRVDAKAVMLNVTAVTPAGPGFFTVYPCGIERPATSNLNYTNATIPNAVVAKVGVDGKVCIYTENATHIIADAFAYVFDAKPPTCPVANPTIPIEECVALVALYDSTNGDGWPYQGGWNTATDPCTWRNVACNSAKTHVVGIDLSRSGLVGPIPKEIGNLAELGTLDLWTNRLSGPLPPEIGKLTKLTYLSFAGNELSGAVPHEIGSLTNLTSLILRKNLFTSLPPDVGKFANLAYLWVDGNRLTTLPPEIGNLTNLTSLDLSLNRLSALPPEIGNLTKLTSLAANDNRLTTVPPSIGNLTELTVLTLARSPLNAFPPEITKLTKLGVLHLNGTQLQGVPAEIGKLSGLSSVDLSDNAITSLPPEIGKLTNVRFLWLYGNQLTVLPSEIGNMTNLRLLNLAFNRLSGDVTAALGPLRFTNKIASIKLEGNRCLSTTDRDLAAWLTGLDPLWNAGC